MRINNINSGYNAINCNNNSKNTNASCAPTFKGADGLTKFYENAAKSKPFTSLVNKFSHSNNSFTHLIVMESCLLSGFYMINSLKNKKIKKEQKPQMMINEAMTLGVSTMGAYLADNKINSFVSKASEKYFAKNADFYTKMGKKAQETMARSPKEELMLKVADVATKSGEALTNGLDEVASTISGHLKNIRGEEGALKAFQVTGDKLKNVTDSVKTAITENAGNVSKAKDSVGKLVGDLYDSSAARSQADKVMPGIGKLKSIVIFGLIYRYMGPVVITPIANKISSKLFENKNDKAEAADKK